MLDTVFVGIRCRIRHFLSLLPETAACGALCLLLVSTPALAQSRPPSFLHWAYASFFGTGKYELGPHSTIYAFTFAPRRQLRDAHFDEHTRHIGIEFRAPLTLGAQRVDLGDLSGTLSADNASTLSAVPGVEIEIPIGPRWSLKPIGYAGWGRELSRGGDSAVIYWAGVKSRLEFQTGDLQWSLNNSLVYMGYSPRVARSGKAVPLLTGFEFARPMGDVKLGGDPLYWNWHVAFTTYLRDLSLPGPDGAPANVSDEWELGIAFSKGGKRLKFWRFGWDRVGIAYRVSGDGRFKGLSLVFHSLFDR